MLQQPFRDDQRDLLAERVWAYRGFSEAQRAQFEACVKVMVAERQWEGTSGFDITEEVQLTIAGNASLMLLGASDYYFQTVTSILVFPLEIARSEEGHTTRSVGEAWQCGGVLLSWPEVVDDTCRRGNENVVIHEFSHHLDGLDGEMGGSIPFPRRADQQRWHEVARREYDQLVNAVRRGKSAVLNEYGAENLAEFFAVASESFFQQPRRLERKHAELYELMQVFYQVDPLSWLA